MTGIDPLLAINYAYTRESKIAGTKPFFKQLLKYCLLIYYESTDVDHVDYL